MLIDKVPVKFVAGKGGNGFVAFGRDRKPSGGDGGNGGNVILKGTHNLYDLGKFSAHELYEAEDGQPGGKERRQGRWGADMILKVPLTTIIFDEEGQESARIDTDGQEVKIASGGRGGLGNWNFRAGQVATLNKTTKGKFGTEFNGKLELRLNADVVFIGFPNAGKSTVLNALTNARARVASYPFTTKEPHLGVSGNSILMDLPGLIEGAHQGKGMGDRYTKHAETARMLAHFISLESSDIVSDYNAIRTEVGNLSPKLADIPEVIVLTKADMIQDEAEIHGKIATLKKLAKPDDIIAISAFSEEDITKLGKIFD